MHLINPYSLRVFREAAKHLNFTTAAGVLNMTPSAVSHAIKQLERDCGYSLFHRVGKKITITKQGENLISSSKGLLNNWESLSLNIENTYANNDNAIFVNLAAPPVVSESLLAPAFAELGSDFAIAKGSVLSLNSGEVLNRCAAGLLDVGLCFSPQPRKGVTLTELHRGELKICIHKNSKLYKTFFGSSLESVSDISIEDEEVIQVLNETLCLFAKASVGIEPCYPHADLSSKGIVPKISVEYDSYAVAMSLLKHINSWSLIPEYISKNSKDIVEVNVRGVHMPYSLQWVQSEQSEVSGFLEGLKCNVKKKVLQIYQ